MEKDVQIPPEADANRKEEGEEEDEGNESMKQAGSPEEVKNDTEDAPNSPSEGNLNQLPRSGAVVLIFGDIQGKSARGVKGSPIVTATGTIRRKKIP